MIHSGLKIIQKCLISYNNNRFFYYQVAMFVKWDFFETLSNNVLQQWRSDYRLSWLAYCILFKKISQNFPPCLDNNWEREKSWFTVPQIHFFNRPIIEKKFDKEPWVTCHLYFLPRPPKSRLSAIEATTLLFLALRSKQFHLVFCSNTTTEGVQTSCNI